DMLSEKLGISYNWYIQYWYWIKGAVQGDFGQSFRFKMDVIDLIQQRMTNTIWLALLSLIFTYMISIPLGITSGRYNDTWGDRLITGYTYIGFATPIFIFSLLTLWILVFQLGLFRTGGSVQPDLTPSTFDYFLSRLNHMLLPSLSMSLIATVSTVQYLRS